ncbi:hypothetical protein [Saccharothrix deserti]|uniref:hypothetical protein n=1 Tax=Saccharothrix deserti TaxID=2593674 RepID=UPI00131C09FC|nr:hypothetical protein [Saccharothrix deserti]
MNATKGARAESPFWRVTLDLLALAGPAGLVTGVLYYFGYISAKAFYSYFGVSLSALDFAPTSYLMRTADTFFRPAATLLTVAALVLVIHRVLGLVLDHAGAAWVRQVVAGLGGVGVVLGAVGLAGLYGEPRGLVSPISLAASALLVEYTLWTVDHHETCFPAGVTAPARAGVGMRRGVLVALVLIAVFWAVTNLAEARGTSNARLTELALPLQPQAVVYSQEDLHLPGPGVGVARLEGEDGAYRFRYNGLRPLLYANDRWFLLPVGWKHDNGSTVIVLQDDPGSIRVDLAPSHAEGHNSRRP